MLRVLAREPRLRDFPLEVRDLAPQARDLGQARLGGLPLLLRRRFEEGVEHARELRALFRAGADGLRRAHRCRVAKLPRSVRAVLPVRAPGLPGTESLPMLKTPFLNESWRKKVFYARRRRMRRDTDVSTFVWVMAPVSTK